MTYYVIMLAITSNDIPLSPLIAFVYHFVPDDSPFQYTKPHPFIVEKHSIRYHTCWDSLLLFLLFRSHLIIIEQLAIQAFFGLNPQSEPKRLDDQAHGLLNAANTGIVKSQHLDS